MSIKQLITLSTDLTDSESVYSVVVSMDRMITFEDKKLLEYLFKIDLDSDFCEHDITIEVVEEIIIELSDNDVASMFSFEKCNGEIKTKRFDILVNEMSTEKVMSNLSFKTNLFRCPDNSFSSTSSDENNTTFVFDTSMSTKYKSLEELNKIDTFIGDIIAKKQLKMNFTKETQCCINEKGQRVSLFTYLFPDDLVIVERQETSISFDSRNIKEELFSKVNIIKNNKITDEYFY